MENTKEIDGRFRFCTFQTYDGLRRHYICGRHEYCCPLGCCVSSAFSFYQLWYFWLLILLIILLCSGGGWWFRWRHGNFAGRTTTPAQGGRRRGHGRGGRTPRVYPHTYYTPGNANACNLPPGYDKDPPSYNEVISHLSQFPRADGRHTGISGGSRGNIAITNTGTIIQPSAPDMQLLSVPPPTYQMVLEQKRRESQVSEEPVEVAPPPEEDRISSTRRKIQRLLGRARNNTSEENPPPTSTLPPPVGSFPTDSPSSSSSSSTVSSGLFTISRESLPPVDYYSQNAQPPSYAHAPPGHPRSIPSPSDSESTSHSDYSSSFLSSPSSISRSPSASPLHSPPSYAEAAPSMVSASRPTTSQIQDRLEDHLEIGRGEAPRPLTGRSVLSRPTTSISTRSLPPPDEVIARKTSLPGALAESDGEENENGST